MSDLYCLDIQSNEITVYDRSDLTLERVPVDGIKEYMRTGEVINGIRLLGNTLVYGGNSFGTLDGSYIAEDYIAEISNLHLSSCIKSLCYYYKNRRYELLLKIGTGELNTVIVISNVYGGKEESVIYREVFKFSMAYLVPLEDGCYVVISGKPVLCINNVLRNEFGTEYSTQQRRKELLLN